MIAPPDELLACLQTYERFLITAHRSPEGDAIGASLGLALGLRAAGKLCETVNTDGVPAMCRFLPCVDSVLTAPKRDDHEVAVIVDVDNANPARVAAPPESIDRCPVTVVIDHHASSRPSASINWIVPTACAAGELVYRVLERLPGSLTADAARCLYAAIATDTGAFRYRNTSADALRVAAELVALGADPSATARHLFDERSLSSRKLLGLALQKMEWEESTGLSWCALTREDFERSHATDEDTEGIVNFIHGIEGARLGVLFRESADGEIRVSLRATPPVDVSTLAQRFGGGGHALAAGCRQPGPLAAVRERVLSAIREGLPNRESPERRPPYS